MCDGCRYRLLDVVLLDVVSLDVDYQVKGTQYATTILMSPPCEANSRSGSGLHRAAMPSRLTPSVASLISRPSHLCQGPASPGEAAAAPATRPRPLPRRPAQHRDAQCRSLASRQPPPWVRCGTTRNVLRRRCASNDSRGCQPVRLIHRCTHQCPTHSSMRRLRQLSHTWSPPRRCGSTPAPPAEVAAAVYDSLVPAPAAITGGAASPA